MKKTLLTLAVGAMALTSCTSESVHIEGIQSNTIKFRNVVNKDSRAMTMDTFGKFYVYGYYTKGTDLNTRFSIFTDTEVTKNGDTWSSAINRFWVPDATYSFYAYSCENKHIAPNYGGPALGLKDGVFSINYTCHTEGDGSHDMIFASATNILGKETGNDVVNFQFKHILSKLNLKFISEFPEGYIVEISNITISQFKNEGTFTASKNPVSDRSIGSWSNIEYDSNSPNTFTLNTVGNATTSSTPAGATEEVPPVMTSYCHLVPHQYGAQDNPVKIQFNIRVTNKTLNQTILSNTLSGTWKPNWIMGTAYTYNIRLSGNEAGLEEIKFGVSIADWDDPQAGNTPEDIQISLDYQLTTQSES